MTERSVTFLFFKSGGYNLFFYTQIQCYDEKDVITGTNSTDVAKITKVQFNWIVPFLMHETIDQRCIDLNKVHREPVNGHMRPAEWYVDEVMGDVKSDGNTFTKTHLAELLMKLNFRTCTTNEEGQLCNLVTISLLINIQLTHTKKVRFLETGSPSCKICSTLTLKARK